MNTTVIVVFKPEVKLTLCMPAVKINSLEIVIKLQI